MKLTIHHYVPINREGQELLLKASELRVGDQLITVSENT